MPTIYIDDLPYEIKAGQNLLHAVLSLGFNLPYFCWHPAMGSVGACRQCAVKQFKDESDKRGKIVMACMTPASDGTRISIDDPEVRAFRASVIEWLMVNHPHDCPVCDEGGECHLQDMTVMTGHDYREFRFKKRTHRNQYLGPLINHEMNRCIACYRCVRFYREVAGGRDFDVFGGAERVYFGRHQDGVLESEFSGNLVEICPTGVFTDKTLKRHYTRKWDLQTAPSICVHCGLGCNTIPGERYGTLRRVRNRYNDAVNGYFLCDRGRYGYEFVNSPQRVRQPLLRESDGGLEAVGHQAVLEHAARALGDAAKVIGIGSPRASLEANFALRTLVGAESFYQGVSSAESKLVGLALRILREGPARAVPLHEVSKADVVLVLGEDVTNTAPMLALELRQLERRRALLVAGIIGVPEWNDGAVQELRQDEKARLYIATPYGTKLEDIAMRTCHAAPGDIARLGFAVANLLNPEAVENPGLPDELCPLALEIAQALNRAKRPLVITGTSCDDASLLQAAADVAWALCDDERTADLCFVVPHANSMGLALMGGGDLEAAFQALRDGAANTAIVLENDLYRHDQPAAVDTALEAAEHVIVVDHLENATTARAEIVLPGATYAEADGTLVNNEGRVQRFYQVFVPEGDIQESWRWLRDVMQAAGREEVGAWESLDDITAALIDAMPAFGLLSDVAPPEGFRVVGQRIARQTHRYTGRTAMHANVDVSEPKPPDDPDSPLSFSMEGFQGEPPPALIPRFWAPGWNSVQALNKFQSEVAGPLRGGDPGQRLIEPAKDARITYFTAIPEAFEPRDDEWLVVPVYHIFGSEELSVLSPGIAELAPQPYLGLNPQDAGRLEVQEGDQVKLGVNGFARHLSVKLMPSLAPGLAGFPAGLPGLGAVATAAGFAAIQKIEHE
jgi:NADH-quinone oxidoreductase subunit G